jgi:nicotinamidase-related amidase
MTGSTAWLVVIDMQTAFGDPSSEWVVEGWAEALETVRRLVDEFGERVVHTRFVRDPAESGQWRAYYDRWSGFRVEPEDAVWELTLAPPATATVVDAPTFSKWVPALEAVVGDAPLVICGVATECCVLSTALAAADAGRRVSVVADGCAGATSALHEQALAIMDTMTPLISVTTADRC